MSLFLSFFILTLSSSMVASSRVLKGTERSMAERYEQWMVEYGRTHKTTEEKLHRFEIFMSNVQFIESFNAAGNHTFELGINQFADLTNQEFRAMHTGFKPFSSNNKASKTPFKYANFTDAPESVDWRTKGAVTPIKDQGQCGSCWAFSAVASMEGAAKLSTGKLISLSEQELVDCDIKGDDQGCEGGLMDEAFKFIINNGGLNTEDKYPYTGADDSCDTKKAASHAAAIKSYEDVPANSEADLLKAVANQPVSVAIDAGGSFQFYSSGVYSDKGCGNTLDHGVAAVGYGVTSNGTKYWIVKNSWGEGWGEKGYVRMERDIADQGGMCGIAMAASYPTA
ncbi:Fruit bromelain protein [Dioscorea alata]|uniref:Fruit bromelain protein n=2 Tax=Dioscorea alata TaxID=55571 RepID=A0ACB7TZW2_DIOAL|nr:Fruit bromelain protein [Dioscorea alata]